MIVKTCKKHGDLTVDQCFIKREKRWGNRINESHSCKYCKKESSDKYRLRPENKIKHLETKKNYRLECHDKIAKHRKMYVEKNREKVNETERKRRYRNIDHTRKLLRTYHKKMIDNLDDSYIKSLLSIKYGIAMKDVPEWMIDIKRAIVQLRRKIRNAKD